MSELVTSLDWTAVRQQLQALLDRPPDSPAGADHWFAEWGTLEATASEYRVNLLIRTRQNSADEEAAAALAGFDRDVSPELAGLLDRFKEAFLDLADRGVLDADHYAVAIRDSRADRALHSDASGPLLAEEQRLAAQYDRLLAGLTVKLGDAEKPLFQTFPLLSSESTDERRAAWIGIHAALNGAGRQFGDLLSNLISIRQQIAATAGCEGCQEHVFRKLHRFDYGERDCQAYAHAVREFIAPLLQEMAAKKAALLGTQALAPWDADAQLPGEAAPLHFDSPEAMTEVAARTFEQLDPEFARIFEELRTHGDIDLEVRAGKSPGGFLAPREKSRRPFLFANANGTGADLTTLLHESGHAFHVVLRCGQKFLPYRRVQMEMAELAALTMELLALPKVKSPGNAAAFEQTWRRHLAGVAGLLARVALVDRFQAWLYSPAFSVDECGKQWSALRTHFGLGSDHEGAEQWARAGWMLQPHLFRNPFYYIEYGIAQIGALRLWERAQADEAGVLAEFKAALRLGGSRTLRELYATAGLEFDFSPKAVSGAAALLRSELARAGMI